MQQSHLKLLTQPKTEPPSSAISRSNSIRVRLGDKWLIAGTTGSGKTTFSRQLVGQLLRLYPKARLYVLDSKYAGDFDGWPGTAQTEFGLPPKPANNQRVQVWQPIHIVPETVETWLERVLKDAPAILYVDELVHLVYKKNQPSLAYSKILKVGRALPVGVVTCTQELAEIPRSTVGQTTHIARFRLLRDWDRRVIDSVTGVPERLEEPPDMHGFYYASMREAGKTEYFWNSQAFFRA